MHRESICPSVALALLAEAREQALANRKLARGGVERDRPGQPKQPVPGPES